MEFITDKGSKIPLVDLPHNVVYNESGSYPQHRRRKVDDDCGDLLLTLNDADWINHILRCNNIDFKIISLLKSPDGPWVAYNDDVVQMNPMYPLYSGGEWIYSVKVGHVGQLRAVKESMLVAL